MDIAELAEKLREHFKRTSSSEIKLPSGHRIFESGNNIWVNKDGGSVEFSLIDDEMQAIIWAALPELDDPRLSKAYQDLSTEPDPTEDMDAGTRAAYDELSI